MDSLESSLEELRRHVGGAFPIENKFYSFAATERLMSALEQNTHHFYMRGHSKTLKKLFAAKRYRNKLIYDEIYNNCIFSPDPEDKPTGDQPSGKKRKKLETTKCPARVVFRASRDRDDKTENAKDKEVLSVTTVRLTHNHEPPHPSQISKRKKRRVISESEDEEDGGAKEGSKPSTSNQLSTNDKNSPPEENNNDKDSSDVGDLLEQIRINVQESTPEAVVEKKKILVKVLEHFEGKREGLDISLLSGSFFTDWENKNFSFPNEEILRNISKETEVSESKSTGSIIVELSESAEELLSGLKNERVHQTHESNTSNRFPYVKVLEEILGPSTGPQETVAQTETPNYDETMLSPSVHILETSIQSSTSTSESIPSEKNEIGASLVVVPTIKKSSNIKSTEYIMQHQIQTEYSSCQLESLDQPHNLFDQVDSHSKGITPGLSELIHVKSSVPASKSVDMRIIEPSTSPRFGQCHSSAISTSLTIASGRETFAELHSLPSKAEQQLNPLNHPGNSVTTIGKNGKSFTKPLPSGSFIHQIKLSAVQTRGRSKGTNLRPIGLPKKGKGKMRGSAFERENILERFSSKTLEAKIQQLLSWLIDPELSAQIMSGYLIKVADIMELTPVNVRDSVGSESIDDEIITGLKTYCERAAFFKLKSIIKTQQEEGPWTCESCTLAVTNSCLECDGCLLWHHLKCVGLKDAPEIWFCLTCRTDK